MSWTLAITGKGGVGKTTLAALAVRWLSEHGRGPVLAVDADPNTCLDGLLGLRITSAVGSVREEVKQIDQAQGASTGGMGKQHLLELKIQESLIEGDDFDLIAMGRPEGPGCYCYANNVLGAAVRRLADEYPAVVIDNEAGLENLSRRIVRHVDQLVFLADPSARGLDTARRLYDLALEMNIDAAAMSVVVNRVRHGEAGRDGVCLDRVGRLFEDTPVEVAGWLPEDAEFGARDEDGRSILTLPNSNPVFAAAAAIFERLAPSRHN
ncbi:MAG: ATP-binding protein [Planctomycetota bacterium]|jgi:CO dehydrogenase maturation factor